MPPVNGSRGLRFEVGDDETRLIDVRCGTCAACGAGRDFWCFAPQETGPLLGAVAGVRDSASVRRWTSALAALTAARHPTSATLLVLANGRSDLVAELVAPYHSGAVLVAPDARDPQMRRRLAELNSSGRAPLVLTVTDARAAVRAVERGGQVCAPDEARSLPSVTELVQRDVTLVSARSIDSLVTGSSWSALADRLSRLLAPPTTVAGPELPDGARR